jgi:hypothetical protein
LLGVSARAAYTWHAGAFDVGPEASLGIEHLSASGFGGSAASSNQSAVWAAAQLGALAAWRPAPRFAVRLVAGASAPTSRPSFVVLEPAPLAPALVHRPPAVSARAALGVEVHFF